MIWHHPKYYKELEKIRKEFEKRQAASAKRQAIEETVPHNDIEEASGVKLSNQPVQASSGKRQAPGRKLQASGRKQQDQWSYYHGTWILKKFSRVKDRGPLPW